MTDTYKEFSVLYHELNEYKRLQTLIDWDMYTQTPRLGYESMAETLSWVTTRAFSLSTSDRFYELLEKLNEPEEYEQLSEGMQYSVRTLLRDLTKEKNIPESFITSFSQEQAASRQAWEDAKRSSDYSLFAPHLQKVIDMTIERCGYTDPGKEPYDVLLDQFEEGMDANTINTVFEELKEGLLPLIDRIAACPEPADTITQGTYPIEAQKKVQDLLVDYIGFNREAGVLSESEHPFTTGLSRYDVRITNHFMEHDPLSAMFSAIHEGGHGIFEQNVAPELMNTQADDCCYYGVHESQSRFYENILARRRSFWVPIYPRVQELLPDLQPVSLDDFASQINKVSRSLIRTEADEVTYALHIILRYEVEQEIFRNHVKADELPAIWNEKSREYLHLTPPDAAHGILQDMHWSDGSFGYFPSYLLGSIYDGMFLEAMEKDLGDIDTILENGQILKITHWLNEKIHRFGCLHKPKEVITYVCGKPLSAQPLLNYFTKKYSQIYHLD